MESAGTIRPRDELVDTTTTGTSAASERPPTKRARNSVGSSGGGGRGAGYSAPEVSYFLSLLEEHLPVTNREWKAVVRLHNAQFPSLKRTPTSLRRKFSSLCRSMGVADESTLSAEVRRALHAKRRMKSRGDVPDDDDEPDSEDEEGENDDDSQLGNQRRQSSAAGMVAQNATQVTNGARFYGTPSSNGQPSVAAAPMAMPMASVPVQFNSSSNASSHAQYVRSSDAPERLAALASGRLPSDVDLIELIKMQLLQNMEDDRRRRADEQERRDEERRHREEERLIRDEYRRRYEDERARREQDLRRWEEEREESRRRHEEFMQLILSLVSNKQ